jgi:hypothetical protein
MLTAKIKSAKKEVSLVDNASYLDIHIDILSDGAVVTERAFAFPLTMTEEDIKAEVAKYLVMYENDHKLAADAEAKAKAEVAAEEVLSKLTDIEIGN